MPLAAILLGLVLLVLAFRGTEHEFAKQAAQDFGGGSGFFAWFGAVTVLGAIGFYRPARQTSDLLMGLVIVVLVLRNGGLFSKLASVIEHPPAAAPAIPLSDYYNGASSSGGPLGQLADLFGGGGGSSGGGSSGGSLADASTLIDLGSTVFG